MEFPVKNRQRAILRSSYVLACLLVIFGLFYIYIQSIYIVYIALIFLGPLSIYFIYYIKKQNIKSLIIDQNSLLLDYKKKKIKIPLSAIRDIADGLNTGLGHLPQITKTYVIRLNTKYGFGDKILIDYKATNLEEDPIPIKVLKLELQRMKE